MQQNTSRYCQRCNKAHKACICGWISPVENTIPLLILQHTSEVNHAKGTARILSLSLSNCEVIVGECFDDNSAFQAQLNRKDVDWHILYPNENATLVSSPTLKARKKQIGLILLDGTWKKAYKMFQLSESIKHLPSLTLPSALSGHYKIRKTSKSGGLSTVEAGYHALSLLLGQPEHYQPLLSCFEKMVDFHINQLPPEIYERQFGASKKD
ncbi:DTW domain-containing protein [Veronia nyctiphanis]|uniref:tRNA-uridine aminocarboxypropyltransferase n=1 Tax=Veronia nyctiphanis TaxID=1278244 RepID=A0A4Q0YTY5_9GAMM|nr:tRNA-uridine aminocarboxypropyltransferase [Veronia nyctiphanis]RXJ74710.1 DTW domain-containing protein [Veronia nyctiphanis]